MPCGHGYMTTSVYVVLWWCWCFQNLKVAEKNWSCNTEIDAVPRTLHVASCTLCSDFRTVSISITLEAWRTCWTSGIKFHDTALFSEPHDATCQTTLNSSRMVMYIYVFIYLWFIQRQWLATDWYESGTKPSWSELEYYLGICLEWLRKSTKSLSG